MTDEPTAEMKIFEGELQLDRDCLPITFCAGIDPSGEIELKFDIIPFNAKSRFLLLNWQRDPIHFTNFLLRGAADDGTRFESDQLIFTSVTTSSDASGTRLTVKGSCSRAELFYKLKTPAMRPALRARVKGLRSFGPHNLDCPLGKITMGAQHDFKDWDVITGFVAAEAPSAQIDPATWHAQADSLLMHVLRIMSLASATMLRAPVFECVEGDVLTVRVWSQAEAVAPSFPVFHFLDHDAIFQAAVQSFFHSPVKAERLFFAIEWFAMHTTYNEVRLVAGMTALENLIDSNVGDADGLILSKSAFDRTRRVLLKVIRSCIAKWESGADQALPELSEKLAELNRKSFLRKLIFLAKLWNVPLDGISEESLRAAKQARDRVVHRGQYYDDATDSDADLLTHVAVIREVVVRFLLTAIGFKGRYISWLGGQRQADFPPASNVVPG